MGLGGLEPEAPQGPETTEDGPEGHRRSTTDLTLIRRVQNRPDPGKQGVNFEGYRASFCFPPTRVGSHTLNTAPPKAP